MRAAVAKVLGEPYAIERIEVLAPGPHDVLVRTSAAAYCITDTLNRNGVLGKQGQTVFGHSALGTVVEVGLEVTRVAVGDRVQCGGTPECGRCRNCGRGRPDQCAELARFKLDLGTSLEDGQDVFTCPVGGYAEIMRIPEWWAFPVDSDLPDEILCMLGCGITSALGAVFNIARVEAGSTVAILGAGQLGLWMTQAAAVAGADRIIVSEPIEARRALALELGATDVIDPDAADPVEQAKELTSGAGPDYTFEAAGSTKAMTEALRMTANTGVVVLAGVETAAAQVTLSAVELAVRGRDIRNCQNGRCRYPRDLPRFIEMIDDGRFNPSAVIADRYPLSEINVAAERALARQELTAIIVPALEATA